MKKTELPRGNEDSASSTTSSWAVSILSTVSYGLGILFSPFVNTGQTYVADTDQAQRWTRLLGTGIADLFFRAVGGIFSNNYTNQALLKEEPSQKQKNKPSALST